MLYIPFKHCFCNSPVIFFPASGCFFSFAIAGADEYGTRDLCHGSKLTVLSMRGGYLATEWRLLRQSNCNIWDRNPALHITHVHCRDFNIFSSHGLLPSDLVAQSVERRRSNPKVAGSIPTLVRVFLSLFGPISISRANTHMVHMG